ncbi:Crp/Fnr family transcriptional regulator [Saccharomonospora iraqiensis]|uniref:Crp/Fnr family transcriptional regulator n=1 Tax=Saccharomonospora iraqiensis TaxID=52698 RepID=UPI001F3B3018|nr:Crp/Fnr family transcriptional regulator [Saccharomonospora iraqiensis]
MREARQPGWSPGARGFRAVVPTEAWASLVGAGVRARHRARQPLLRQGDPGGWTLLCLSGRLAVRYAEPDGREIMLAVRGPGDVVGEFSERDGKPRSATVVAIEPGITVRLPDRRFGELLRRFALETQLNGYILDKIRESAAHAWRLAHHPTATRLADLLDTLVAAAGPDHPAPHLICLSQQELAAALGLARSAVTPVLAEWKARGLIRVARGRLEILDLAGLADPDVSGSGQNRP